MFRSTHQEEFSLAYVHSVAAAAGVGITISVKPDIDGIDVTFAGFVGRRARLEAQVKSFTYEPEPDQAAIPYDLKVPNHKLLTIKTLTPRILILVTLPKDVAEWCAHGVRTRKRACGCTAAGTSSTCRVSPRRRRRTPNGCTSRARTCSAQAS